MPFLLIATPEHFGPAFYYVLVSDTKLMLMQQVSLETLKMQVKVGQDGNLGPH